VKPTHGFHFVLLLTAVVFLCPLSFAQDVQISASIESEEVGALEQFELTVRVSGRDSGDAESPRLPRLKGLQIIGGPNVSTSFQWINGSVSSSKTFTYVLLPEKEGQYTIDPIEVRVGGKTHQTAPLPVRVVASQGRRRAPPRRPPDPFFDEEPLDSRARVSPDDLFVEAELDRGSAYVGQQVTLSYHLLTRIGVTGVQLQESPPLSGFWVEDLDVPKDPTGNRKIVGGREYLDFVLKRQALFPTSAGPIKIPPSTFAISAKTPGDFFGVFGRSETVYRKSRELTFESQPLPSGGKPADFSNAVGSFNLSAGVDKERVATGEAVALRVKLEGRGNLKMISDVAMPSLPDFTVYPAKRADNIRPFEGNLIGGDKTWEYVIVPKAAGSQMIPPLAFSYFDPAKHAYETVKTSPIPLEVDRGTSSEGGVQLGGLSKQNITRQGTDINFIKLNPADLNPAGEPPYRLWWFYLVAALPVSFTLGAFLYQRQRAMESGNVVLARSRKARRVATARLRKAEAAGRSEPRRFYDGAALALSGYLADRFNLSEIAVTGDSLERTLAEKGVAPETIRDVVGSLQESDFGRFVSASPSGETMRALATRIRAAIDKLEQKGS
jgi:hypothetical protein